MIALYHPWCHPEDWNGRTKQNKTGNNHRSAIPELCEKGSQHNTERKPGLPPARSPEITQCKPHGQQSSQNWSIQGGSDAEKQIKQKYTNKSEPIEINKQIKQLTKCVFIALFPRVLDPERLFVSGVSD